MKSLIMYELYTMYMNSTLINQLNNIWKIEEIEMTIICDFDLNTPPYLCAIKRIFGLFVYSLVNCDFVM